MCLNSGYNIAFQLQNSAKLFQKLPREGETNIHTNELSPLYYQCDFTQQASHPTTRSTSTYRRLYFQQVCPDTWLSLLKFSYTKYYKAKSKVCGISVSLHNQSSNSFSTHSAAGPKRTLQDLNPLLCLKAMID